MKMVVIKVKGTTMSECTILSRDGLRSWIGWDYNISIGCNAM